VRHVAAADGCRLAVHSVGDGPPLLCVPGGPGRAAEYLEDLGGLSRSRQLLLLDNRGTGASELPADRSSLQFPRLADDLVDVQRELALSPADLLGHSAGCPVVLLQAARRVDGVRRLVLVTPSGRPFGWVPDDLDEIRAQRSAEPWFADASEAQAAIEHANPRLRSELEKETRPFWYGRWDERAQAHATGADRQMSLRANAGFAPDEDYDPVAAREALRAIRADVLIVVGGRDALTGASVAGHFLDVLPKAEVATIDGAGHFPWVDEPYEFREVVEAFLAR
jgi:pimeloyl-ACP methyl ester carboxylesterase